MKKWVFLIIAALFGFEEYQLNKVRPMVAPDKDVLPPIHDLVVPIAGEGSAESLTRQIEAITRSVDTKSLQRILIIGNESVASKVKKKLRSHATHSYRIQTAEGDLRVLIDPLTSMLTFSDARNVLICAPENELRPILLRAYEAELDLIALASSEYLDSGTVSSGARNWFYKWRAIIDTL